MFLVDPLFQWVLENPNVCGPDDNSVIVLQLSFSCNSRAIDEDATIFLNGFDENFVFLLSKAYDCVLVLDAKYKLELKVMVLM